MNRFTELLNKPGTVVVPACYDALTARLSSAHGFPATYLAGYDFGASLVVTEPLVTATETTSVCLQIKRTTDIPLMVDIGAGYGEPMHVVRAVRDLALVGVEAVQLEDQIYPKRAHYFKDYEEHIVSLEEMVDKITAVKEACGDSVAVIARTDAFATDSEEEAHRRVRAFGEAGADGVMAFPRNDEEAARLPKAADKPVVYVNTLGNRTGRPVLDRAEAEKLGYSVLLDTHNLLFAAFDAMESVAARLATEGKAFDQEQAIRIRKRIEEVLDVKSLWQIEARTVER